MGRSPVQLDAPGTAARRRPPCPRCPSTIDLDGRRIQLAGHAQSVVAVHAPGATELAAAPPTNPATHPQPGTSCCPKPRRPVSPPVNHYLKYPLLQHGIQLELFRGDRCTRPWLAALIPVPAAAFNLCPRTAITYCDIARSRL